MLSTLPSLPIADPILIFAIAILAFLTAPIILHHFRLPGIVGILLVGAAIGPNALGLLDRDPTIVLLGDVGIVYLMFLAGLEINVNQFIASRKRSVVFGTLSFLIPQAAGTAIAHWVLGFDLPTALLFASIFASHTLLAYPVINRLGIAGRESVTVTIGGTILTDTLALLVLAVVLASTGIDPVGPAFWIGFGVGLIVYLVGIWLVIPRLARWFFRTVDEESYFEFLFVLAILFVTAWLADVVGIEPIVGAFLAGLAINRMIPKVGTLMNRIEFVGNALFIPFFLLSVGMLVDIRVLLDGTETILLTVVLLVLVCITKYAAAHVTAAVYAYSAADRWAMAGLSVGQAAAALAIVLVGFEAGLFGEPVLNATILMILVVSLVSPLVVDRYGRGIARLMDRDPWEPADAEPRIMVPLSPASEYPELLIDMAIIIRGDSSEPLYALTIVEPNGDIEREIVDLDEALARAARYSAGADIPVQTRTRLNRNTASGIGDAMLENRITTLLIGWDGAPARRQSVFGHTIDRVLVRTRQLVFVTHVRSRVGLTDTVILVLPPGITYNPGAAEALHHITKLADRIGASVRILAIQPTDDRLDAMLTEVGPDMQPPVESVEWATVTTTIGEVVDRSDLVVLMSARRGTMGWDRALETLPMEISKTTQDNFMIVYPAIIEDPEDRRFLRFR